MKISAQTGGCLDGALDKDNGTPCCVCHRKLKVFCKVDHSAKRTIYFKRRPEREEAIDSSSKLMDSLEDHGRAHFRGNVY